MAIDHVNPLTGKVKEYKNSAEWMKDVEAASFTPPVENPEVRTYADASQRLREEIGLDLRSPAERQQAEVDATIEQRVAAGVSAALAKAQESEKTTQTPPAKSASHSAQKSLNEQLSEFATLIGWKIK